MSRIEDIKALVSEDATALKLINSVERSIDRYADTVLTMQTTLSSARFRLDGQELRELTVRLDRNRHTAHESLIDSIRIANRYLFKTYGAETIPAGGVYDADPLHLKYNNRDAIGQWALAEARKRII